MIKDRGNKKWVSIMLPEHVKMLRLLEQDSNKVPKPVLDEQEIEQIGNILMDSLNFTLDVKFSYWQSGYIKEFTGVVHRIDYHRFFLNYILEEF